MKMFLMPISPFTILIAGFYSFMWGLWIATPAWDAFDKSPIYATLNMWSGEELVWGLSQMAIGLVLMFAAFDSLRFMKYATFAGFCSWTLVTISFTLVDYEAPGVWLPGFLAALHAHLFLNVKGREK